MAHNSLRGRLRLSVTNTWGPTFLWPGVGYLLDGSFFGMVKWLGLRIDQHLKT